MGLYISPDTVYPHLLLTYHSLPPELTHFVSYSPLSTIRGSL